MFNFIVTIFRVFFLFYSLKHMDIVIKNAILKKENEILRLKKKERIKELILDMKNKNLYWGYKRIQGELLKLGIELDKKTIWNYDESSQGICEATDY